MWNLLWESRERREKVFTSPNSAQFQSQGKGTGNEVSLPHPTPLRCLPTILDKIKWNSNPPIPPNQGWSRAKGKTAPLSHPWFGEGRRVYVFHLFCPRFNLVPRAFTLKNGCGGKSPTHFLKEKPWGRGCAKEQFHVTVIYFVYLKVFIIGEIQTKLNALFRTERTKTIPCTAAHPRIGHTYMEVSSPPG